MVTSRELADVVGDALGITRESAQLHLKTIRAAGEISFKGYGRAAAAMTALDASRLVIAAAGSTFAKDSLQVLKRFAKLRPVRSRTRWAYALEDFLAELIAQLPMEVPPPEYVTTSLEWQQRFGSRRLADTALQLLDPIGAGADQLAGHAIVRWLDYRGHPNVLVFGPDTDRPTRDRLKRGTEIHDLFDRYSGHRLFQVRVVKRDALIDVAAALNGNAKTLR